MSVGYNLAFYFIGVAVCIAGLALYSGTGKTLIVADKKKIAAAEEEARGTRASADIEDGGSAPEEEGDYFAIEHVELVFKDLRYFVIPLGDPKGDELELIKGVTGFAVPGTLTALMGASGAGKSTLMDVIAGRKTSGRIEGEILMNGVPKDQRVMNQLMGYCEQTDIHSASLTVRESLIFSAVRATRVPAPFRPPPPPLRSVPDRALATPRRQRMRLPRTTPWRALVEFVDEQMRAIELDTIANNIVGLPGISGLSVEQRKRLTIGVELAANPSVIFMVSTVGCPR